MYLILFAVTMATVIQFKKFKKSENPNQFLKNTFEL